VESENEDVADNTAGGGGGGREEVIGARRSRKKKQGLRRRAAGERATVNRGEWEVAGEEQWEQWPEALLGETEGAGAVDVN
jgi:hypothetical protein